jgi:hypothetical protein
LQSSCVDPDDWERVAVGITSDVGDVMGVSVGRRVGVAVSVGGTSVAVGMASSVWAIIVKAAASAVCWISNGLTVAVA